MKEILGHPGTARAFERTASLGVGLKARSDGRGRLHRSRATLSLRPVGLRRTGVYQTPAGLEPRRGWKERIVLESAWRFVLFHERAEEIMT
jgi:hypothetical protein